MIKKKILILIVFIILFLPFSVLADTKIRAYRSNTRQTIPSGQDILVELNAETYDTLNEFDNYRFTATNSGYYQVNAGILYATPTDQQGTSINLYKNGNSVTNAYFKSSGDDYLSLVISDIVYLDIDGYLELYTYQNSGIDKDIYPAENYTFLSISYLFSMPDIYTLIQNATTDAEFYLNKSLSYGDILILIFLTIFVFWGISHFIFTYYFKRK